MFKMKCIKFDGYLHNLPDRLIRMNSSGTAANCNENIFNNIKL